MIGAALLGIATWSVLEYAIHRWLGHDKRWIRNVFGVEHTAHHARGHYFAPTWKKGLAAVIVAGVAIGPAVAVAGPSLGGAYVAGFVGFYLTYELIHRLNHTHAGWGPYGRWARRHHFWHHFHDPKANFGVTSPVWDVVFGTRVVPGRVLVPERLAMPWLVDPATGEVRAGLAEMYGLRRVKGD
jgi:sterol desaturase/sphingolipid hydroxylase (fatty acid hydroxylase superfamily)